MTHPYRDPPARELGPRWGVTRLVRWVVRFKRYAAIGEPGYRPMLRAERARHEDSQRLKIQCSVDPEVETGTWFAHYFADLNKQLAEMTQQNAEQAAAIEKLLSDLDRYS